jgi:hypothetical protein
MAEEAARGISGARLVGSLSWPGTTASQEATTNATIEAGEKFHPCYGGYFRE